MQSLLPFFSANKLEFFLASKFTEKGLKTSAYVIILAGENNYLQMKKSDSTIFFTRKPDFLYSLHFNWQQCLLSAKTFDKL
jgi:hypothetical protein